MQCTNKRTVLHGAPTANVVESILYHIGHWPASAAKLHPLSTSLMQRHRLSAKADILLEVFLG